jgi:peptide deformylase
MTHSLSPVPDSILKMPAAPVESAVEALEIIRSLEKEIGLFKGGCLGLAAPQIGIPKAVGVVTPSSGSPIYLINPKIVSHGDEFVHEGEACMSLPGRSFKVPRYDSIEISNQSIWLYGDDGSPYGGMRLPMTPDALPPETKLAEQKQAYVYSMDPKFQGGIICIAVQHEIEHLQGIILENKKGAEEIVRAPQAKAVGKVGRNDPCPCGSGKKFKKCCG